jgi:hypothetical protein
MSWIGTCTRKPEYFLVVTIWRYFTPSCIGEEMNDRLVDCLVQLDHVAQLKNNNVSGGGNT